MSSYRGPVPDRWMYCPRKASNLIVNKFMAMKTPLCSSFDSQVPQECRFPPKMLFELCKVKKIKFGLWIDLTNTKRFYDKTEVEENDTKYVKLSCRGHGEFPSLEQTKTFVQLVNNFIRKNPLEAIAVHCTHGFNRTGFLIVSYLVEEGDCDLESALSMFSKVRPPGIYKGDYIEELYRRYDDIENTPSPPSRPDWESDSSQAYCPISSVDERSDEATTSTENSKRNLPKFMEGVSGVVAFSDKVKAKKLKDKVRAMCSWEKKEFPGSQPVTLSVKNIYLLGEKPYKVSWKADGTRYLMLINGADEVYFFDRDFNIFKAEGLKFLYRKNLLQHLNETLVDGEMVIDKVDGVDIPRFLVYDIIKFLGQDVGKMPFQPNRMYCIENDIINARKLAMESGLINQASEPFSIRMKQFWDVTQAENLLGSKFAAQLCHEPDGLIFQPMIDPYVPGRCDSVLKWKPTELNSVDFRMKIVTESGEGLVTKKVIHLFVGGLNRPFAKMKYRKDLKDLQDKIIECKYQNHEWVFMRQRFDKSFPNSYTTASSVCDSIREPVTKQLLLEFIKYKRYREDREIMPPPPKRR